jgi:hypothetical protein
MHYRNVTCFGHTVNARTLDAHIKEINTPTKYITAAFQGKI